MIPANNQNIEKPLATPVLFLVFNRPDTTRQVFEAIRQAKPPRFYIASDGARVSKESETEKVQEVRELILAGIDWPCEVKTLFRDQNLGCREAVTNAIDWFFENEEAGIILEDDCLPSQSFFRFCETLLEKYKTDTHVMCISGDNFVADNLSDGFSYLFSEVPLIWGWASWRRAWDLNKNAENVFKENQPLGILLSQNKRANRMWWKKAGGVVNKKIDTWDYLWSFTNLSNNGLTIIPANNLVTNIGMGHSDSTHTGKVRKNFYFKAHEILFPLSHPPLIKANQKFDNTIYKNNFNLIPLWKKIVRRLF
jgi:hypothetical protein